MRVRLLLVNEYFTPHAPGGAERSVELLARSMAGRGHDVVVATTGFGRIAGEDEIARDCELGAVGVRVKRLRLDVEKPGDERALPSYIFGNPLFHRRFAKWIAQVSAGSDFDVMHAQGYDALSASVKVPVTKARRVATIRDYRTLCPISICLHDQNRAPRNCSRSDFFRCCGLYREVYDIRLNAPARIRHDVRRSLEWMNHQRAAAALRKFHGAVFVSNRVLEIYRDAGLAPERCVAIPNLPPTTGGSMEDWVGDLRLADRRLIVFVGRYSLGKGAAILSEAMANVARNFPNVVCVVAGRREYAGEGPNMIFLGQISAEKIRALYRDVDLVVLPSRWQEPFSRVLLEAMSAGKPVVATDSGGNAEAVLDGVNGRLVPRNNPDALAEGILDVLNREPESRRTMGDAGRRIMERKFSDEAILSRYEEFYLEVMRA